VHSCWPTPVSSLRKRALVAPPLLLAWCRVGDLDVLFLAFSTLPATVPVAAALLLRGVALRRAR
jgi:hypothetical protein